MILSMVRNGTVTGLDIDLTDSPDVPCKACLEANLKQRAIPKMRTRMITSPLQVVGSDIQTVETPSSDGGKRYFSLYVDAKTNTVATTSLKAKSDQPAAAKIVIPRLENLSGQKVDTIRCDQGGEYTSNEFKTFCQSKGIKIEMSDTNQPFQNGLAETTGGKLLRMMRAARIHSRVPKKYWPENLAYQTWIANRVSTKKQKGKTTPYEQLSHQKSDLSMARPYGCEAWVIIRRKKKEKLSPRAERGVFIGISSSKKAWRILLWSNRQIIESRNVSFRADTFPFKGEGGMESERTRAEELFNRDDSMDLIDDDNDDEVAAAAAPYNDAEEVADVADAEDPDEADADAAAVPAEAENAPRRSSRIPSRSADSIRFDDIDFDERGLLVTTASLISIIETEELAQDPKLTESQELPIKAEDLYSLTTGVSTDPKNERQAWTIPEWREAERKEWQTVTDAGTYEIVERPTDEQVIPSKMVYRTKNTDNPDESLKKARFVVRGCFDREKNEKQKYAPTLKFASFRILFALAAIIGAVVQQIDVKGAFLNGDLPKPIYTEQPINLAQGDPTKYVLKLKKSLYGLAESPRLWNERFDKELKDIGFTRLESDPCVYVMHSKEGQGRRRRRHITILGSYVDDIMLFGTNNEIVEQVRKRLRQAFKLNELGRARWALGMAVHQLPDAIILSQKQYLTEVLERFGDHINEKRHNPSSPLPEGTVLTKAMSPQTEEESRAVESLPYRELIGCLLYLAVGTRPDIAFAIGLLSRFVSCYGAEHWAAALHVLRYLRGTPDHGLRYAKRGRASDSFTEEDAHGLVELLQGYVDADFATDPDTSRSVSGQIFTLNGGAISWRAKQQSLVTTSTCHAEYVAACEASRETVWLREFLSELGFSMDKPTHVFEDNEAARFLSENPATTERSKHIRLRWHYLRQCVRDGTIRLMRVDTKSNAADALTKPVSRPVLELLRDCVNLGPHQTE